MNPMTNVKNVQKYNALELERGIAGTDSSWHHQYRDSAWIFVGGLNYDLTEGDVVCVFSQFGEIVNVNLVRDKKTGKSKGFCFLCYENQKSTVLAVDNLNGVKLTGRTVRVDHVEEYKLPKDVGTEDETTMKIREEGIHPSAMTSASGDLEGEELDDAEEGEEEELSEKKKKKKKKKEKKKKKRRRSSGSTEEEEEEEKSRGDQSDRTTIKTEDRRREFKREPRDGFYDDDDDVKHERDMKPEFKRETVSSSRDGRARTGGSGGGDGRTAIKEEPRTPPGSPTTTTAKHVRRELDSDPRRGGARFSREPKRDERGRDDKGRDDRRRSPNRNRSRSRSPPSRHHQRRRDSRSPERGSPTAPGKR